MLVMILDGTFHKTIFLDNYSFNTNLFFYAIENGLAVRNIYSFN